MFSPLTNIGISLLVNRLGTGPCPGGEAKPFWEGRRSGKKDVAPREGTARRDPKYAGDSSVATASGQGLWMERVWSQLPPCPEAGREKRGPTSISPPR